MLGVAGVAGQQVGDLGLRGGSGDLDGEAALAVDLDGQGQGWARRPGPGRAAGTVSAPP